MRIQVENDYNAIKFYSNNDMSIGHHLEQAEPVISSFDPTKQYTDINEIIELYNIQLLMDSGVFLKKWDANTVDRLKYTCNQFNAVIGRFFSGIDNDCFTGTFQSLNILYISDFWHLFSQYKAFQRVAPSTFISLLSQGMAALWPVLEHKAIVDYYDSSLADFMRKSDQSAELILDSFLSDNGRKYYFPKSLQVVEFEDIFAAYIESPNPNLNYLKLLIDSQSLRECPISPKLQQKAKHRFEAEIQKKSEIAVGFEYGISVGFADIEEYIRFDQFDVILPEITYSTKWIKENLDYPTLLNNFCYLFEQVDSCWRSNLVSIKNHLEVFEKTLGIRGKKEYQIGVSFQVRDKLSLTQVQGYRAELRNNGVNLEEVFRWFFEEYLKDEFQAGGFSFHISSDGTSFVEKCRNLAAEMDGILKQFRVFLQDGYIDRELFEMTSEHIVFSNIPSFMNNKYAYANCEDIKTEMHLLYSDQSMLHYTEKTDLKYKTLPELLRAEEMTLCDFNEYQIPSIKWLIERDSIREDNKILRLNEDRAFILKDLFEHEVICPNYYRRTGDVIENMVQSGDLRYGSTLFSEPEQSYLNYQLNRAEFSNGLDLRNKYIHSSYSQDIQKQEADYDRLLRTMALIIMKINEEFCLKFPLS